MLLWWQKSLGTPEVSAAPRVVSVGLRQQVVQRVVVAAATSLPGSGPLARVPAGKASPVPVRAAGPDLSPRRTAVGQTDRRAAHRYAPGRAIRPTHRVGAFPAKNNAETPAAPAPAAPAPSASPVPSTPGGGAAERSAAAGNNVHVPTQTQTQMEEEEDDIEEELALTRVERLLAIS